MGEKPKFCIFSVSRGVDYPPKQLSYDFQTRRAISRFDALQIPPGQMDGHKLAKDQLSWAYPRSNVSENQSETLQLSLLPKKIRKDEPFEGFFLELVMRRKISKR